MNNIGNVSSVVTNYYEDLNNPDALFSTEQTQEIMLDDLGVEDGSLTQLGLDFSERPGLVSKIVTVVKNIFEKIVNLISSFVQVPIDLLQKYKESKEAKQREVEHQDFQQRCIVAEKLIGDTFDLSKHPSNF